MKVEFQTSWYARPWIVDLPPVVPFSLSELFQAMTWEQIPPPDPRLHFFTDKEGKRWSYVWPPDEKDVERR